MSYSPSVLVDASLTATGTGSGNIGTIMGSENTAGNPSGPAPTPATSETFDQKPATVLEAPENLVDIALNDPAVQDQLAAWDSFRIAGVSYQPDLSGAGNYTAITFAPGTGDQGLAVTALVDQGRQQVVEVRDGNGNGKSNTTPDKGHGGDKVNGNDKDQDKDNGSGNNNGNGNAGGQDKGSGNGKDKPKAIDKPKSK